MGRRPPLSRILGSAPGPFDETVDILRNDARREQPSAPDGDAGELMTVHQHVERAAGDPERASRLGNR
jgi:hypothetical protein